MDTLPEERRSDRLALWLVVPLALALAAILLVFYGLYRSTTVDGDSMLPTLKPSDRVLVTRGYPEPKRGDVVVVHLRDNAGRPHDIVKRVVAVPGDTVAVTDDVAFVNGSREASRTVIIDPTDAVNVAPTKLKRGTVFLMGDNRPVSYDSRFFGAVPLADVQGKVVAVFAPVTRARSIH